MQGRPESEAQQAKAVLVCFIMLGTVVGESGSVAAGMTCESERSTTKNGFVNSQHVATLGT